jgi:hypothetical protein
VHFGVFSIIETINSMWFGWSADVHDVDVAFDFESDLEAMLAAEDTADVGVGVGVGGKGGRESATPVVVFVPDASASLKRGIERTPRDADEDKDETTSALMRFERAYDALDDDWRETLAARALGWGVGAVGATRRARLATRARFAKTRERTERRRAKTRNRERDEAKNNNKSRSRTSPSLALMKEKKNVGAARARLREWVLDHFDAPFPTRGEKEALAKEIFWSPARVSNWFINSRVRFWKPIVLELAEELEREDAGKDAPPSRGGRRRRRRGGATTTTTRKRNRRL